MSDAMTPVSSEPPAAETQARIAPLPPASLQTIIDLPNFRDYEKAMARELQQLRARETTWIPVTERLPDDGTHVLVTVTGMFGDVAMDACFLKGAWLRGEEYLTDIPAWQPLPAPYKVTP